MKTGNSGKRRWRGNWKSDAAPLTVSPQSQGKARSSCILVGHWQQPAPSEVSDRAEAAHRDPCPGVPGGGGGEEQRAGAPTSPRAGVCKPGKAHSPEDGGAGSPPCLWSEAGLELFCISLQARLGICNVY